ncbi:Tir chaperone protein (CesT) [compost metagenome]
MSTSYTQLLTDLAERLGVDSASLCAQQVVCIDGLNIFMQQSGAQQARDVVLCSVLGTPSAQPFPEVLRTMMLANHRWAGTGGGTLGLSPAGDAITWCMRLPLRDLDGATLAAVIAGFAELGRAWMQYLAADARDEARESPPALLQDMRV